MKKFQPSVDCLERRESPSAFFGVQIINNGPAVPTTVIVRPFQSSLMAIEPLSGASAGSR